MKYTVITNEKGRIGQWGEIFIFFLRIAELWLLTKNLFQKISSNYCCKFII